LTLPVLILGFLALYHNGVTAIDGRFVQILMTTTGRTGLEAAASKGCLGGEENVPDELNKMKIWKSSLKMWLIRLSCILLETLMVTEECI
jgi:hypothetical protein